MSNKPQVNGDLSQSQTLNHFVSYPLIHDLIATYQRNSLGATSISAVHSLYQTFAEPVLPYLQTPYSVVKPYLVKADSLGDQSLNTVDSHFPALKSTDLEQLKGNAFTIAYSPFQAANNSVDYVVTTYQDEYKKVGGEGIATTGKAVISTELRIVSEVMHAVADYVGPKKDQAKAEFEKVKKNVQTKKDTAVNKANSQVNSH